MRRKSKEITILKIISAMIITITKQTNTKRKMKKEILLLIPRIIKTIIHIAITIPMIIIMTMKIFPITITITIIRKITIGMEKDGKDISTINSRIIIILIPITSKESLLRRKPSLTAFAGMAMTPLPLNPLSSERKVT